MYAKLRSSSYFCYNFKKQHQALWNCQLEKAERMLKSKEKKIFDTIDQSKSNKVHNGLRNIKIKSFDRKKHRRNIKGVTY